MPHQRSAGLCLSRTRIVSDPKPSSKVSVQEVDQLDIASLTVISSQVGMARPHVDGDAYDEDDDMDENMFETGDGAGSEHTALDKKGGAHFIGSNAPPSDRFDGSPVLSTVSDGVMTEAGSWMNDQAELERRLLFNNGPQRRPTHATSSSWPRRARNLYDGAPSRPGSRNHDSLVPASRRPRLLVPSSHGPVNAAVRAYLVDGSDEWVLRPSGRGARAPSVRRSTRASPRH